MINLLLVIQQILIIIKENSHLNFMLNYDADDLFQVN